MTDPPNPSTFEDRPPAKVNLTLGVLGRRPDGFHELASIFLGIGLTDRLTVSLRTADGPDRLTVTGLPGTPTQGNLVLRALDALRSHAGVDFPPLDVSLEKRIPVAAGLGGGSSDAASALHLAQVAWGVRLAPDEEVVLATSLGSDVPFFYSGAAAALVGGRGDLVSWLPASRVEELGLLLVTPAFPLSTAKVFARYDDVAPDTTTASLMNDELEGVLFDQPLVDDLLGITSRLRDANDLWLAASSLEPSLPALRAELETATGRPWMMSGSGPTLFALYPSATEAAQAGQVLLRSRSVALDGALVNAVDLVGPEPAWRHP